MGRVSDRLKLGAVAAASCLVAAGGAAALRAGDPAADVVVANALDPAVPACSNFYRHACGGFLASAKVDEARPEASLFDDAFDARLEAALAALFAERAAPGSELARLKTFYAACRASAVQGSAADDAVLRGWLERIEGAATRANVQAVSRALDAAGVGSFLVYGTVPDPADWPRWQGSLGAAELFADEATVRRAFELSGLPAERATRDATAAAGIAAALRAAERTDTGAGGRPVQMRWTDMAAAAPGLDWPAYRRMVGARADGRVEVPSRAYLAAVGAALRDRPVADLRAFLRWRLLLSLRGELPARFAPALRTLPVYLRGDVDDPDRRCRAATTRAMGVSFSRQFATRILGEEARREALRLSREIRDDVIASVERSDWLSASARARSVEKLRRMDLHIGFPDRWPAAGSYALDPHGFLANVVAARRFGQRQAWARAGALRDRSRWQEEVYPWVGIGMAAERLTVPNGFPDPYSNSLVMTAAFLMPPRLAKGAPAEANYATYGVTFGHELTHVLEYYVVDAEGRPNDIWEPSDVKAHDAKQSCVIDQADAFVPAPGVKNRGERQSDENIADLGGIRLAHAALAERLGAAMTVRGPDGRTPEQRFFLRYAQSYCAAQTPERLAAGVAGDPHGPAEFRVNGPLANLPAFARAFGCGAGDAMVRPAAKMCRIW